MKIENCQFPRVIAGDARKNDPLTIAVRAGRRCHRSADFQSAVSRISNPQTPRHANGLPNGIRRYSRLETCATCAWSTLIGGGVALRPLDVGEPVFPFSIFHSQFSIASS
jgi:hypothetical protein